MSMNKRPKNASNTDEKHETQEMKTRDFWGDCAVIHQYSRADALADGVLIDATELAREAGFRYPVALTSAAWHECVAVAYHLNQM
jgi:hypothetical protein